MVLTRARVVWASDPAFADEVEQVVERVLRQPRPGVDVAGDVARMRALMDRERRPQGFWDLKLSPGGQVDAEFVAQYRQLVAAAEGRPLTHSTLYALTDDPVLADAWRTQQRLSQILAAAFDGRVDPDGEPEPFHARLATAVGAEDYLALKADLQALRTRARAAFEAVLESRDGS
jgi:glutamate-ammonia-ligase adenylyltransferase